MRKEKGERGGGEEEWESKGERNREAKEKGGNARRRDDVRARGEKGGQRADGGQGVGNCATNHHATLRRYGPLLAL